MLSDKIYDFVSQVRYKKWAVPLIFPSEHNLPPLTVMQIANKLQKYFSQCPKFRESHYWHSINVIYCINKSNRFAKLRGGFKNRCLSNG